MVGKDGTRKECDSEAIHIVSMAGKQEQDETGAGC